MKKSLVIFIVSLLILPMSYCITDLDIKYPQPNNKNLSYLDKLQDMKIIDEYNDFCKRNVQVYPMSSLYGEFIDYSSLTNDKELYQDSFYRDTIVHNKSIFLLENNGRAIKAFSASDTFLKNLTKDNYYPNLFSFDQSPWWLRYNDNHITSITQDFLGNAFILADIDQDIDQNTENSLSQEIIVISLDDNIYKETFQIQHKEELKSIRCGHVDDQIFIIASTSEGTNEILYTSLHSTDYVGFETLIAFNQNILTWDCVLNSLIVVLEDQSVLIYEILYQNNQLLPIKIKSVAQIPTLKKDIIVKYNPVKKGILLWEAIENGKSWFYSELSLTKKWAYVGDTCYGTLHIFTPDVKTQDIFEPDTFFIVVQDPILIEGPKGWVESPCFIYLKKTKENILQWSKIEYQYFLD